MRLRTLARGGQRPPREAHLYTPEATNGRIAIAVDHSKLGTRAQARMFSLGEVDLLVTDLEPSDRRLDPYREAVELA